MRASRGVAESRVRCGHRAGRVPAEAARAAQSRRQSLLARESITQEENAETGGSLKKVPAARLVALAADVRIVSFRSSANRHASSRIAATMRAVSGGRGVGRGEFCMLCAALEGTQGRGGSLVPQGSQVREIPETASRNTTPDRFSGERGRLQVAVMLAAIRAGLELNWNLLVEERWNPLRIFWKNALRSRSPDWRSGSSDLLATSRSARLRTTNRRIGAAARIVVAGQRVFQENSHPVGTVPVDRRQWSGKFDAEASSAAATHAPLHGSVTLIPASAKSLTLRVATAIPRDRAIAAIWQSATGIGRPNWRRTAAISA